jgi:hypothetical protein
VARAPREAIPKLLIEVAQIEKRFVLPDYRTCPCTPNPAMITSIIVPLKKKGLV